MSVIPAGMNYFCIMNWGAALLSPELHWINIQIPSNKGRVGAK